MKILKQIFESKTKCYFIIYSMGNQYACTIAYWSRLKPEIFTNDYAYMSTSGRFSKNEGTGAFSKRYILSVLKRRFKIAKVPPHIKKQFFTKHYLYDIYIRIE